MPTPAEIITGNASWWSLYTKETAGAAAFTTAAALLLARRGRMMGEIMEILQSKGSMTRWRGVAWKYPVISLVIAGLLQAADCLRSMVEVKWRRSATERIHDLYFSQMGYYRLQSHGKEFEVKDPDARICTDIKQLVNIQSHFVFSTVQAAVFAVMFSNGGWRLVLMAPVTFVIATFVIVVLIPPEMGFIQGGQAEAESKYAQMLTRVQLHAERIFVLQGVGFEFDLLRSQVDLIKRWAKAFRERTFAKDAAIMACFVPEIPGFIEWMGYLPVLATALALLPQEVKSSAVPLDPFAPQRFTAQQMGVQLGILQIWSNTTRAWGILLQTLTIQAETEVNVMRVQELYAKLTALQQSRTDGADVFSDKGPVISFGKVTVQTPLKQTLLKQLDFTVEEGQMLLICGHNGAGKSSIIRCLCSLWPIPEGTIARPGGAVQAEEDSDLHDEVYYLPQKPCNVLGSLSDQLTYPVRIEGGLPDTELRRWLRYVDMEYLADLTIGPDAISRVPGGDGTEIDWEAILSMGEQQALSIARLLYHRPRFAILDECTSAVGKGLERRLFELARDLGISCITITHRPALKEHHGRMLQLTGEMEKDGCGWSLSDLPQTGKQSRCSRVVDMEGVKRIIEARIESSRAAKIGEASPPASSAHELAERRSRFYIERQANMQASATSAEQVVRQRWPSRLKRLVAVLRLGLEKPGGRKAAAKNLAAMAVLLALHAQSVWVLWRGQVGMMAAAMCNNKMRLFCEAFANFLLFLPGTWVDQRFKHHCFNLCTDLWESASRAMQERAARNGAFLTVTQPGDSSMLSVESPIQRLAEIKGIFMVLEMQLSSVLLPLAPALYLLPTMVRGVGVWSPLLLTFNYLSFRGCQLLAPDFTALQNEEAVLEGRFQFLHTRLRSIAEPVAFSGGGCAERRIIEPRFDAVIKQRWDTRFKEVWYNIVITFFTDYAFLPLWTQRLLSRKFALQNNPDHPGGLTPVNAVSNFLFDRSIQYPQLAVQRLVTAAPVLERLDGSCIRCLELVAAFEQAAESGSRVPAASAGEAEKPRSDAIADAPNGIGRIRVKGLDVVTRSGSCLARNVNFEVSPGSPLVITGPNASGKSLLGSILLGLWPAEGEGSVVSLPGPSRGIPALKTMMVAPQRIYLPLGAMHNQLSYPEVLNAGTLSPPFRLVAAGSHHTDPASPELSAHFARLGATVSISQAEAGPGAVGLAEFESAEALLKAVARPESWAVDGTSFKVLFGDDDAEARLMAEHKASPVPNLPRMARALRAVGIEHVVLREEEGWLTERVWEDTLSGGEQQRLCLARVLYRKPVFALLDECTSMVAADAEEALYRKLIKEFEITPVTLTQRMFMPDLYQHELSLGVRNADGWEFAASASES